MPWNGRTSRHRERDSSRRGATRGAEPTDRRALQARFGAKVATVCGLHLDDGLRTRSVLSARRIITPGVLAFAARPGSRLASGAELPVRISKLAPRVVTGFP